MAVFQMPLGKQNNPSWAWKFPKFPEKLAFKIACPSFLIGTAFGTITSGQKGILLRGALKELEYRRIPQSKYQYNLFPPHPRM